MIILFVSMLGGFILYRQSQTKPAPQIPLPTTSISPSLPASPTPTNPVPASSHLRLYLVAIDDQGKSGEKVGCGDSIIPVNLSPDNTSVSAPLRYVIDRLIADKQQYYGQSGLYNALYQSDLSVEGINITNGTASISLKGNIRLAGVCDNPRVEAQLKYTAMQFPTVKKVNITINSKPLENILSEK